MSTEWEETAEYTKALLSIWDKIDEFKDRRKLEQAFIEAVKYNDEEKAEFYLKDKNVDVNTKEQGTGESAFYIAAARGNIEVLKLLVKYEVDIDLYEDHNERNLDLKLWQAVLWNDHLAQEIKELIKYDTLLKEEQGALETKEEYDHRTKKGQE